jgi:hypothetical protein
MKFLLFPCMPVFGALIAALKPAAFAPYLFICAVTALTCAAAKLRRTL